MRHQLLFATLLHFGPVHMGIAALHQKESEHYHLP